MDHIKLGFADELIKVAISEKLIAEVLKNTLAKGGRGSRRRIDLFLERTGKTKHREYKRALKQYPEKKPGILRDMLMGSGLAATSTFLGKSMPTMRDVQRNALYLSKTRKVNKAQHKAVGMLKKKGEGLPKEQW